MNEQGMPYMISNIQGLISKFKSQEIHVERSVDVLVIGSGPGGYVAAIRAAQLGFKTAVAERAETGGICLNWGCIPTKSLLKSVQALHYVRHAADYGVRIRGAATPGISEIVIRSRKVAADMREGVAFLLKKNKVELIPGTAVFNADKSVTVTSANGDQQTLRAKHTIIATGARANSLPFAPIDGKKIIGYREALVPVVSPRSMAVIGSGAIGCELAWFFHHIGTEVTLIETMEAIAPLEDADVSAQLSRSFRKAGIKVMTSARVVRADTSGAGCTLIIRTKKGEEKLCATVALSATGITANIENIGLEDAGVALERGRIKVDEYFRTNVEGVYAIGDVIATPALAHVASAEAVVCVEHFAGRPVSPIDYDNIPSCMYTTPETASVGLTEKAAREKGYKIRIGKFPFTASGKAATAGNKEGFAKLIFNADDDTLLGAHLIGDNVTEMIAGLIIARRLRATARDITCAIHPHPSMSEAIMEAAANTHGAMINCFS
ncbi:MAG: dihydrolipoyl dehydrogenase [Prevotellaceae bacterium]|jgi:dihydrolipoamide dehydrogenase|nr:dihydrolipoyl dehydrogenase [Prevotellaceae bacterium]